MEDQILNLTFGKLDFKKSFAKGYFHYTADTFIKFSYCYKGKVSTLKLIIKEKTQTDFYSIPFWFRWACKKKYKKNKKNIPACVHDILCTFGGKDSPEAIVDFEECSWIIHALMEYLDVGNAISRRAVFIGVSSKVGHYYFKDTNTFDRINMKLVSWEWN